MASDAPDPEHPSAVSKVLQIVELLEHILHHVDIRTILLSQRVSRTWQATIADSCELQKALFFTADGAPLPRRSLHFPRCEWAWPESTALEVNNHAARHAHRGLLPFYNPFLSLCLPKSDSYALICDARPNQPLPTSATASWRRMLLYRPPVTLATIKAVGLKRLYLEEVSRDMVDEERQGEALTEEEWMQYYYRAQRVLDQAGRDSAPVEVRNEAGVTLGDVIAALPGLAKRVEWLALHGPEDFHFEIDV